MSKNNFRFIKVNPKYIKYLLNFDEKVQYNFSNLKKENKPFLGIILHINNKKYYVPLSSANNKKKLIEMYSRYKKTKIKNIDMFFIEDNKQNLLSVINLNNMIPIPDAAIIDFDIKLSKDFTLLQKELIFCNKNKKTIMKSAIKLYSIVKNHTNKKIEKRCCNFQLLEQKSIEYEEINHLIKT